MWLGIMAIYRWIVCTPCSDKPMNGDMTKKRNSTKIWWYDGSNLQPGWTGKVWKSDDFSIESIYHLIVWRWPWVSAKKHCSCLLPIVWLETSNLWGIFLGRCSKLIDTSLNKIQDKAGVHTASIMLHPCIGNQNHISGSPLVRSC